MSRAGHHQLLLLVLISLLPATGGGQERLEEDAGQVRVGQFWIDRYEYPNIAGQTPRVDVTWEEARQLCADRGHRLCSEAEWEQACRGQGNLEFGYGGEFEPRRCNTPWQDGDRWVRSGGPAASGDYEGCSTPDGVHDMIGNVWEWTDGWYDRASGWRVVRGGSWFHSVNYSRADGRYGRHLTHDYSLDLIGFRCCRSGESGARAD
ncbi:MAG TPA: formylglycine-generating enzyme family protein [Candidatus Latescibacteria bacterium]|nr:formylglycine-generating enzyme family protein [Candidatus Latescibacterota bacterium]HJP31586.1 formylglycine-generating enzyme family protein [Candidatus Latescibacterota bacterium]